MLWIACTILVLLAAGFVLPPLFRRVRYAGDQSSAGSEPEYWWNRKATVYRNIKDLEFEYSLGRLAEADFAARREFYKKEAMEILQAMDQLPDGKINKDRALSNAGPAGSSPQQQQEQGRCPSCGAKALPGKKFCADCGAKL